MKDNEQLSLEEILEKDNDLGVTFSVDTNIVKEDSETKERTSKDALLDCIKDYDEAYTNASKIEIQIDEINKEIEKACPELFIKLNEAKAELEKENKKMNLAKTNALPHFSKVYALDNEEKTLFYGKTQATYVLPTQKHSFDLKTFIEEQKDFYLKNISILDPYSKITDVAGYVKFTVKKVK